MRTGAGASYAQPDLARATHTLRVLADTARTAPVQLAPGVPDPEAAEARLAGGVPALLGEPLLRGDDLGRAVAAIAAALAGTDAGPAAAAVHQGLGRTDDAGADLLARAAVDGAWDVVEAAAAPLKLDPDALATVLDWAARPALHAAAATLAPVLAAARWRRGHCPACGASATLSVLTGKERDRRLHCGRCGTAWTFDRVRCPSCGERDHQRLGYLHLEGEGEYRRAEVCDGCGSYVKCLALLDAPDADRLLELDLETAALDFLALERGYVRASAAASSGDTRPASSRYGA